NPSAHRTVLRPGLRPCVPSIRGLSARPLRSLRLCGARKARVMAARVEVALEGRVGTVRFDNPPVNVLTIAMLEEARAGVDDLLARGAEVLLLRSTGTRAFSAGVDVADHVRERVPRMLAALHGLLE